MQEGPGARAREAVGLVRGDEEEVRLAQYLPFRHASHLPLVNIKAIERGGSRRSGKDGQMIFVQAFCREYR